MFEKIKHYIKYSINPMDPKVDGKNAESRRNWILYMTHRDKKYPVSAVYDKFEGAVSKVTVNTDFQKLEAEGLVRREKDKSDNKNYLYPLFEDEGEAPTVKADRVRNNIFRIGLPILSVVLTGILLIILGV